MTLRKRAPSILAGLALVAALPIGAAHSSAAPAVGNKASYSPDVSSNGRFIVFASDATNLVTGDTNGKRDIFIRDTVTRKTKLVSKAGAKLANFNSFQPVVSDDGRFVAYLSDATNLVPNDTNGVTDAFRTDLTTGATVRVSVSTTGVQANGVTDGIEMSANGSAIAFSSTATNLASTGGSSRNVFLRDQVSVPTTRLVGPGDWPSVSPNGKFVSTRKGYWSRSSARFTKEISWVNNIKVSNAGPSSTLVAEGDGEDFYYSYYFLYTTASPASLSINWYGEGPWDDARLNNFDVSAWGTVVLFQDPSFEVDPSLGSQPLVVVDATGVLYRKSVAIRQGDFAMAGSAKYVAYALKTGQVVLWTLASGATQTVSVSNG